jgi:cytochrome c peroxidase
MIMSRVRRTIAVARMWEHLHNVRSIWTILVTSRPITRFAVVLLFAIASSSARSEESLPPLSTPDVATVVYPDGRPPTKEEVELGKLLFFDKRLSINERISCATCHNPDFGFSDGLARSYGAKDDRVHRNAPSLYNLAWAPTFFWDGRAKSLEEQALVPIQAPNEMGLEIIELVKRLNSVQKYQDAFAKVYPKIGITDKTIAKAIASFERTLVSHRSPFDRYLAGDKHAMSDEQIRGMQLFSDKNRGNCMACHNGPNFTDYKFHNIGLPGEDQGRAVIAPTEAVSRGAFKTPSLRNVAATAPYMHDGSLGSLEQVVVFYNGVEGVLRPAGTDPLMKHDLDLSEGEVRDIVTFMSALSDPVPIDRPVQP